MKKLKGVVVGAGYFSDFHYDAWSRISEVEIVALSDLDGTKASEMQEKYNIAKLYTDFEEMIRTEKPDFVDIVTPPATHFEIIKTISSYGIPMICQKPLAPTFAESEQILLRTLDPHSHLTKIFTLQKLSGHSLGKWQFSKQVCSQFFFCFLHKCLFG